MGLSVSWPLLVLMWLVLGTTQESPLTLVQLYFLGTPHRWITFVLVLIDPSTRTHSNRWVFPLIFSLSLFLLLGWIGEGLELLIFVDYFWNAWHFGSQHYGMARILTSQECNISRKEWGMHKQLIRLMVVYVFCRAASIASSTDKFKLYENYIHFNSVFLRNWDFVFMFIASSFIFLYGLQLASSTRQENARKNIYLVSISLMYLGLLIAIHFESKQWIIALATVNGMFHAFEYLALVFHRVNKVLYSYINVFVFSAFIALFAWVIDVRFSLFWGYVTAFISYVHYAYDTVIWKKPKNLKLLSLSET